MCEFKTIHLRRALPLFSFPFLNPNKSNIFRVQVHASPCYCPVYVFHFFSITRKSIFLLRFGHSRIYSRLLFQCWGDLSHFHTTFRCMRCVFYACIRRCGAKRVYVVLVFLISHREGILRNHGKISLLPFLRSTFFSFFGWKHFYLDLRRIFCWKYHLPVHN